MAERRPFEAHEALEEAWRRAGDPLHRDPLARALIQLAAAYVHRARGNPPGAAKLRARVADALGRAPDLWHGVDMRALAQTVSALGDDPDRWPDDPFA